MIAANLGWWRVENGGFKMELAKMLVCWRAVRWLRREYLLFLTDHCFAGIVRTYTWKCMSNVHVTWPYYKTRPKRLGSMSPDGCLLIQLEVHLFIMPTRKQFQLPKAVPQKSSSKTGKCHQWFKKFSRILFKAAQPFSHTYDKFFYSEVLQSFESFD